MYCVLALLFLLQSLPDIITGVEQSFGRMSDLSADFVQISKDVLNRKQEAGGHVYLKRPRMARWEYTSPEEQLFVSDGKTVYFYVPADKQVNREAVKDTFDDRIPLMFLMGRSNLRNEFTKFELLATKPFIAGTKVVRMTPKRKTDLKELLMEVDPQNFQIRRLVLDHSDGSHSEFIFSNIRTNTGLRASLFDFKVPPGVQVVEGLGQ
ncbi:MAG: outer membrane lipoprotein carrier protein LolA [Acidobacteria bacterium]|nr:MAG: outer membrane lipoprotein carrier protein LolA [Acidobacteriota bacterium]